MTNSEIIALAEERAKKRAEETAYNLSDNFKNKNAQKQLYDIYKGCIMLGARIMQEELMNLTEKSHE